MYDRSRKVVICAQTSGRVIIVGVSMIVVTRCRRGARKLGQGVVVKGSVEIIDIDIRQVRVDVTIAIEDIMQAPWSRR